MPLDQFLIAPIVEGLQNNVDPWLIPEEAFANLKNAYVWRGKLRKRFGSRYLPFASAVSGAEQLNSRLRIVVGTTDPATGNISSGTDPLPAGSTFKIGQMFSVEDEMFTSYQATGAMYSTGSGSGTFDTGTGVYAITGAGKNKTLYWYPSEPVMGLVNYEQAEVNEEDTFAFDTIFAYKYLASGWTRLGTAYWTGSNSQFFWGENYRGNNSEDRILFVTNNSPTDYVRYWDGSTWTNLRPAFNTTGNTIDGCRIIIAFKDRLLMLNTWETIAPAAAVNHPNRVRYCQNGTPLVTVDTTSWHEGTSTPGKGGFIDAPTKEAIISAKILRDRLIVFFERSTWELVFTGNKVIPFVFQRINSELGAESTFSTILFDRALVGVGNVGIHACNGASVERIDEKIPQEVFKFHNGNNGVDRVYGIRDYHSELAYWTLPDQDENPTYPTQVLVYNYRDKTWALNDDSITCFGYFQNVSDLTWQEIDWTWAEWEAVWDSGSQQSEHRYVVAGNQQGYTFLIDQDISRNAPALQITNLSITSGVVTVTCIDHNLQPGDYVLIENVQGTTNFDGIYLITTVPSTSTFTVNDADATGTYEGAGTIARVSQIDIQTKEYNFYQKQGADLYIPQVAFYVDRTEDGEITLETYTSSSGVGMQSGGDITGAAISTGILETRPYESPSYEETQKRFWHVMYPQAQGEVVQFHLFLDNEQMLDSDIALSDFTLNAISIYARPIKRY